MVRNSQKNDLRKQVVFLILFVFRQAVLLRGNIRLSPRDIVCGSWQHNRSRQSGASYPFGSSQRIKQRLRKNSASE